MKKKARVITVKPSQPTDLEYIKLFNDCVIDPTKLGAIDKVIDDQINTNKNRYQAISKLVAGNLLTKFEPIVNKVSLQKAAQPNKLQLGFNDQKPSSITNYNPFPVKNVFEPAQLNAAVIPWYFIACAHYLECNFSFKKHLHNGDPLTGYTIRVPANRPKVGHEPPFTFEESAVDALKLMKLNLITTWNLPTLLRKLEAFNGFGYFKYHSINSPYLWSFSNQYVAGKYVSDGKFDSKAISQQMGAAVILKRMEDRALIYTSRH